jgi:hypothetical protein
VAVEHAAAARHDDQVHAQVDCRPRCGVLYGFEVWFFHGEASKGVAAYWSRFMFDLCPEFRNDAAILFERCLAGLQIGLVSLRCT